MNIAYIFKTHLKMDVRECNALVWGVIGHADELFQESLVQLSFIPMLFYLTMRMNYGSLFPETSCRQLCLVKEVSGNDEH